MAEEEDKFIDVEKLIASKNPKMLKRTPKFFINYLKRKLHQDEINDFMQAHKGDDGFKFSKDVIDYFSIELDVKGLENIPQQGGAICTLNHPLGGMDAMALITELYPYRQDFKFIVNDLLLHLENLKEMFVGVNKHGAQRKGTT